MFRWISVCTYKENSNTSLLTNKNVCKLSLHQEDNYGIYIYKTYEAFTEYIYTDSILNIKIPCTRSQSFITIYTSHNGGWTTELEIYTTQTNLSFSDQGNWIYFIFLKETYKWNWLCDMHCCYNKIYKELYLLP
jgi:hypothetical protein